MKAHILKIVIGGIEIPVDPNEDKILKVVEQIEAVERSENFACLVSTSCSQPGPPEGLPSRPLSPTAVKIMNSVIRSNVKESAILRDRGGDL
jgi:hypothetical protein